MISRKYVHVILSVLKNYKIHKGQVKTQDYAYDDCKVKLKPSFQSPAQVFFLWNEKCWFSIHRQRPVTGEGIHLWVYGYQLLILGKDR